MAHSSHTPRKTELLIGAASAFWLLGATVTGHFLWQGVPWIVVLLLAAMAELLVLTVWLMASTLHDPIKRWDLPPNPADAQQGWRSVLSRSGMAAQGAVARLRQKVLRRPAKV